MHRFINIEGVHNFRDFGNYNTQSGNKVRPNILFRSAQFGGITQDGCATLGNLGIKTIVDLRRTNERKPVPDPMQDLIQNSGLKTIIAENSLDKGGDLPPHLQYLISDIASVENTVQYMKNTYRELPFDPMYQNLFKQTFKRIAQNDEPIVIHCAAGKDRTGILCALILHILDVPQEIIIDDYLLTNKVPNLDIIIEKYAQEISKRLGKTIDVNVSRPLGIVDADYIQQTFAAIKNKAGNITNYLYSIDVDASIIKNVKAKFTI